MHDPFQSYQAMGAGPIGASPYGSPYATQTPGFHPGIPQIPGLNPYAAGLQNPFLQNPLLQNPMLQNPLLQQALIQNPLLQQALIQQNPLLQQALTQQNPLTQTGWQNPMLHAYPQQQQFGYPLAPQTFIGAGQFGGGQGVPQYGGAQYGQIHPLALQQLVLRSLATSGINPWAGF